MHTIHQAQLFILGFLSVMFVLLTTLARNVQTFIDDNWNGCHYKIACDNPIVDRPDWSFQQYALDQNMSKSDLEQLLRPMMCATPWLLAHCEAGLLT